MTIEQRVAKLERQNRWMKRAGEYEKRRKKDRSLPPIDDRLQQLRTAVTEWKR